MREFAEQDVVIPEGRYEGQLFSCDRQPFSKHWFEAIESGEWNRFVATGCVQSGKTLIGLVIPCCYHLFEKRETFVVGLPTMDIASDKWTKEILPVIQSSPKLAKYLPRTGSGSRGGGNVESVKFTNGSTLKFMSAQGSDAKRSAFTAPAASITEVDKMDRAGDTSRETDPVSQIENRTSSLDMQKRFYMECTVSTTDGRIWIEYEDGTRGTIVCPCPHCEEYITPEKDDFLGFESSPNQKHAGRNSLFYCSKCGESISEQQRFDMNYKSKVVFRGQSIGKAGTITGEPPGTYTYSLRWNAFNNLLWSCEYLGVEEYRSKHRRDKISAEKESKQFRWVLPVDPDFVEAFELDAEVIAKRRSTFARGICPPQTKWISAGIDCHRRFNAYVILAWLPNGTCYVVDYGRVSNPFEKMKEAFAITSGLLKLIESRWRSAPLRIDERDGTFIPGYTLVDASYSPNSIYTACNKAAQLLGERTIYPAIGRGVSQRKDYTAPLPKVQGTKVKHTRHFYDVREHVDFQQYYVEMNSDHWKSAVHRALSLESGAPGSVNLFESPDENVHERYVRELTNEKVVSEYIDGRGYVDKWVNMSRSQNHFLDATYMAFVAGHMCGVRFEEEEAKDDPAPTQRRGENVDENAVVLYQPSDQPYLITER